MSQRNDQIAKKAKTRSNVHRCACFKKMEKRVQMVTSWKMYKSQGMILVVSCLLSFYDKVKVTPSRQTWRGVNTLNLSCNHLLFRALQNWYSNMEGVYNWSLSLYHLLLVRALPGIQTWRGVYTWSLSLYHLHLGSAAPGIHKACHTTI